MAVTLLDLKPGARVKGLQPNVVVTIQSLTTLAAGLHQISYILPTGLSKTHAIFETDFNNYDLASDEVPWSFKGDPNMFRLGVEAKRISLAHLYDPYLAVSTSMIEPLPHQITAVYEEMLPRQPLRFLLADDPGAGKTIMSGLLIKELQVRGDLKRCLIVTPGSLVEQWQTELREKFSLKFPILNSSSVDASPSGNVFDDHENLIVRVHMFSRSETLIEQMERAEPWDLIIVDEAHKMSAHLEGEEVKRTQLRELGEKLAEKTRHFLLLTATPHNGKQADFEIFMSLIDSERFAIHRNTKRGATAPTPDASDLMRRMVKEKLVKFDGTPLFPERRASSVGYELSATERELYEAVTAYVREQMNRAEKLKASGERRRGVVVGFALQVLQRRLASSPEAIRNSLVRRADRLETKLDELRAIVDDGDRTAAFDKSDTTIADIEDFEDDDGTAEGEQFEDEVIDFATAAATLPELAAEIEILRVLGQQADSLCRSGVDSKWVDLSKLIQESPEFQDSQRRRKKIVIFTEHRDTLNYLERKLGKLLGDPSSIVAIHGAMGRDKRRSAEHRFKNDPSALILLATDAAGEGINLQVAHLMINYDLPWNPNRLEQRFGRIHRIGQTEVCYLWNLLAKDTREGDVYQRLLLKLEEARQALGGQVFDVLGQLEFDGKTLREIMVDAILYAEDPAVRARLFQQVEGGVDANRLQEILNANALGDDALTGEMVARVRAEMEKAHAQRLQPNFIESFWLDAYVRLGGDIGKREPGRYELQAVPSEVRSRAKHLDPVRGTAGKYERVCFEKGLTLGPPLAEFVSPGHPLLAATIDLTLERARSALAQGAVLIDHSPLVTEPRVLLYLDDMINSSAIDEHGGQRTVSRRLAFVSLRKDGTFAPEGQAPHLDLTPASEEERAKIQASDQLAWIDTANIAEMVTTYALSAITKPHLDEVRARVEPRIDRISAAVRERLIFLIAWWRNRAEELKADELRGKKTKLSAGNAASRADDFEQRLKDRLEELALERNLVPTNPRLLGAALVVPASLLQGVSEQQISQDVAARLRTERLAVEAVMKYEREKLGMTVVQDVGAEKRGYDVYASTGLSDGHRFIEVKGRVAGAADFILTRNEMLTCLNEQDRFWLAFADVEGEKVVRLRYAKAPITEKVQFGMTQAVFTTSSFQWEEVPL